MSKPKVEMRAGDRYGRWTVLGFDGYIYSGRKRDKLWLCRCDCGLEAPVRQNSLRQGTSTSCGCTKSESQRRRRERERLEKQKGEKQ